MPTENANGSFHLPLGTQLFYIFVDKEQVSKLRKTTSLLKQSVKKVSKWRQKNKVIIFFKTFITLLYLIKYSTNKQKYKKSNEQWCAISHCFGWCIIHITLSLNAIIAYKNNIFEQAHLIKYSKSLQMKYYVSVDIFFVSL